RPARRPHRQLAEQRGTTAALERERQEAVEAERIRRQEELARAAVEEELRRREAAASRTVERESAGSDAQSGESEPSRPTPEPTGPAPKPTRPAPAPSPTKPPPPPTPDPSPPPSSSSAARAALDWARTQVGKPYVWGAAGPNGYDCSGLTQTAFSRAGVSLPRTTRDQYAATTRVPVDALQPGDLIFYSSNGAASGIYHVAIYAGGGMRVHAPEPGRNVEYVPMYWTNVLPYGGRV